MNNLKLIKVSSIALGVIVYLGIASGAFAQSRNSIVFYNIDNRAEVLVNGKVIYDSGVIDDAPELNIDVDLNDYLTDAEDEVTVRLFNSKCPNCFSNPWSVHYEVFMDGESVDYIYESGDGDLAGGEEYSEILYW